MWKGIQKFKSKFHVFVGFSPPKSGCFFGKFVVEQVSKSFSGRNNSLKAPVFRFSNSLLYGLEELRKLRALISWVLR